MSFKVFRRKPLTLREWGVMFHFTEFGVPTKMIWKSSAWESCHSPHLSIQLLISINVDWWIFVLYFELSILWLELFRLGHWEWALGSLGGTSVIMGFCFVWLWVLSTFWQTGCSRLFYIIIFWYLQGIDSRTPLQISKSAEAQVPYGK